MKVEELVNALKPLVEIWEAYCEDGLDESRPSRDGVEDPRHIELFNGRGGKRLLTLAHARDAFLAYMKFNRALNDSAVTMYVRDTEYEELTFLRHAYQEREDVWEELMQKIDEVHKLVEEAKNADSTIRERDKGNKGDSVNADSEKDNGASLLA